MAALQAFDWPGNVRQLRNIVERTIILAPGRPDRPHRRRHAAARDRRQAAASRGAGGQTIMGTPLREARKRSSGSICACRSGASREHIPHRELHRHGAFRAAP
jgi:DNA-binding NtrC family response regulator